MKDIFDNIPDEDEAITEITAENETLTSEEKPQENLTEISDGEREENVGEAKPLAATKILNKVKSSIKMTGITDPAMMKDMFFGSKPTEKDKEAFDADGEDEEQEDDDFYEETASFKKRSRKRMSVDPKQEKKFFSFEYMITSEQAKEGYKLFYNEFVKKKNIKITWLFGILAAGFLFSVFINPKEYINYLLMLISLSVIAMTWLNSYNAKKDAEISADDVMNDSYTLSFYNSRIVIEASELVGDRLYNYSPVMIRFEDIELKVIDYEELYVLIFRKDYIYTVPKQEMTEGMNAIFKRHLSDILGDDYREYYRQSDKKRSSRQQLSGEERE